jgi:hypothetical protein
MKAKLTMTDYFFFESDIMIEVKLTSCDTFTLINIYFSVFGQDLKIAYLNNYIVDFLRAKLETTQINSDYSD